MSVPAEGQQPAYRLWPSQPPRDCPFPQSKDITGIAFTGRCRTYTNADTWFPSWASDGSLYSPFTDGEAGGIKVSSAGPNAATGHARILGDGALNLEVLALGIHAASPSPYRGRYPSATLVHNGVWYYGTYCLDPKDPHLNWDVLGPFVGFRISKDYGRTWADTPLTPSNNLFRESGKNGAKVKMGAPHFVDFGRNMEHAPDGRAYLVGHGATRPDATLSWISGDQIYLARVAPSPENINDLSKYEFFAGHDERGEPKWSHNFGDIRPLAEWNYRTGCVTMTYNAPLKKYLMCVTDGFPTIHFMSTYILESNRITGPWRLVTFMKRFGEQGYFVNIPSKFISADGRTAFLWYSHNFTRDQRTNPPGGAYALTVQEIKLLSGDTAGIPTMDPPK